MTLSLSPSLIPSPTLQVLVAPGNGGTASCHPKISNLPDVKDSDVPGLVAAAKKHAAGLVAIGPEAPLVAGIADALAAEGIPCFGPTKLASNPSPSPSPSPNPHPSPHPNPPPNPHPHQVRRSWRRSSRTRRRG